MKPLCAVCDTRHESYQAHVFAKPVANAVANKNRKGRYKDVEKRKVYMRELMRKRRAAV